MTTYVIIICKT